jgi:YaiO family outer membrane protein
VAKTGIRFLGPAAIAAFLLLFCRPSYAARNADVEKLVQKLTPPLAVTAAKEPEKDTWYIDGYYEPSRVLQNTKSGFWNEFDYLLGLVHKNITGYMYVSQQERFDNKNQLLGIGSYINMDKDQYTHFEGTYGWGREMFLYQFQSIAEYGHRLYENLFAQINYTYRCYRGLTDDNHLIIPSLIYYFGDSYMSASYGANCMEAHDTASFGVFKGDFAITKFLRWTCGVAVGGKLYDINGWDAKFEQGYILFTGVNINLYKGVNCRFGYSYGTEAPKFIKRSVYYAVSVKF